MKISYKKIIKRLLLHAALVVVAVLIMFSSGFAQFYNGSQMSFGKSRIQYKDFLWTYYKFDKFDIYFYLNGRELAITTAKYAIEQIPVMEQKLQTGMEQKIQFIVYNNLTDLKQSNIGLASDERYNTGGITHIIGSKVFLYFNGEQRDFEKQIRAGIANVLLNQAFYGTSVGSQVKNTTLFTLPEWYSNGLVSFLSDDWNTEIDNRIKDGILSGRYKRLNNLTGEDALFAGHMLWKYVSDKFGPQALTDIVSMTQISRSIDNGFLYVIGVSYKTLVADCLAHFKEIYQAEENGRSVPENVFLKKIKKDHVYSQFKFSPGRIKAAYVDNDEGRYKIMIQDITSGKKMTILRGGFKLEEKIDYTYPVIAWHPSGKLLTMMLEKKGEIYLYFYNLEERHFENIILYNFEKVTDFSYSPDGKSLVFSGVQKGQSDLYIFNIAAGSHQQLTNDIYDDLQPVFVNGTNSILFASNRPDEELRWEDIEDAPVSVPKKTDLYLLVRGDKENTLRQVTNTPLGNEVRPVMISLGRFAFLSDENGINNRYFGRFDSTISYVDTTIHYRYFSETYPATNYSRNILDFHVDRGSSWLSQVIYSNGKYVLQSEEFDTIQQTQPVTLEQTSFRGVLVKEAEVVKEKKLVEDVKESFGEYTRRFRNVYSKDEKTAEPVQAKTTEIDINNYTFDNQAAAVPAKQDTVSLAGKERPGGKLKLSDAFAIPKRLNYRVEYSINQMAAQLDFTALNFFYQPYGGGGYYGINNLGLNGFFQVGMTDLLENHRIIGGFRIPLNLSNIEYLFSYANLTKRLDKEILAVRQAAENEYYIGFYTFIVRQRSYQLYYILKYPFSPVFAVKGTANVRYQKSTMLSTNEPALREPDLMEYWGGLKGEVIYDDTKEIGLNLMTGTRFKIFGEYTQILEKDSKSMFVVGFDVRNYQRIHRSFIWANRLAASTSFGKNKLIYYLGGVDNWLSPRFETATPVDNTMNYAYQAAATNLRGFNQNVRNGNSMIVYNSELRFPVFRYFANQPIKSDFMNNFQIVGFGDIGLAWAGKDPYSEENSFYIRYIQDGSLWIKVREQKEPLVGGFGFGARTRVLGYFLRGDVAWGVEDRKVKQPIFYLSLSLDF
jgi:WD40 repeat protein